MTSTTNLNCGREHDLVSFLYRELAPIEQADFERHMHQCAGCKSEIASFGEVRESIVNWRNESLAPWTSRHEPVILEQSKPSALAAFRQFFALSPLWMKGAVAFASLLFFVLAGLAIARLNETKNLPVAATNNIQPSQEQFKAAVEERVRQEMEKVRAPQKESTHVVGEIASNRFSSPRPGTTHLQVAVNGAQRRGMRPLSRVERQELATDLRLTADANDNGIVLIGDRINQ